MFADSITLSVNVLAINVALASIAMCATALVVACLCRSCSQPLRYALLVAPVLLMLLCPVPLLLGTSCELGVIDVSGILENSLAVEAALATSGQAIERTSPSDDQFVRMEIDSSIGSDESKRKPDAVTSVDAAVGPPPQAAMPLETQHAENQFLTHWRNGNVGAYLLLSWILISLCYGYRLIRGLFVVSRVRSTIKATSDPRLTQALQAALRNFNSVHRLSVFESDFIRSPMTLGFLQPVIVMPSHIADLLSDDELVCTLSHELAHIQRRDTIMAFLQQLATAMFWWNPLLRITNAEINRLRERICDDCAVSLYGSGHILAEAIVKLAEWSANGDSRVPLAHTLFGRNEELKVRISRLSSTRGPRVTRLNPHSATIAVVAGLLLSSTTFMPIVFAQKVAPSPQSNQVPASPTTATSDDTEKLPASSENKASTDSLPERAVLRLGKARFRHSQAIDTVMYSPDGRYLATGTFDKFIRLWDAQSGELIRMFSHSDGRSICSLAFSPDGRQLASISMEGHVNVWNHHTGDSLWEDMYGGTIGSIAFFPDSSKIAFTGRNGIVSVRDAATGGVVFEVLHPDDSQRGNTIQLAIAPNGTQLAFGSETNIYIVDTTSPDKISTLTRAHGREIYSLEYTPDSKQLFSCGSSAREIVETNGKRGVRSYQELRLWDVIDLSLAQSYGTNPPDAGEVRGRISPDGTKLYTSGYGVIRTWNTQTGNQIANPIEYRSSNTYSRGGLAVSPDGRRLVTGGPEHQLLVWDLQTNERLFNDDEVNAGTVGAISYSPDGQSIAVAGMHGRLNLWDRATGKLLHALQLPAGSPGANRSFDSVDFSPEGKQIATTGATSLDSEAKGALTIWDAESGRVLSSKFADMTGSIVSHDWRSNALVVATAVPPSIFGSRQKTEPNLTFIGSDSVPHKPEKAGLPVGIAGCQIGPNAETIRYVDRQTTPTFYSWNVKSNTVTKQLLKAERNGIWRAVFSRDGSTLITNGMFDSSVFVWEPETGRETRSLKFEGASGLVIALSTDGALIAATPHEPMLSKKLIPRTIIVWDKRSGNVKAELQLPASYVASLAFSPGGEELVSGHNDGTVTVWNLH